MERHLDDAALRALEARDARTVAHFRDHLSRPCPECEEFLASAPSRLWWLEAEADRLLHLHGSLSMPPDTTGFRAVRRAMRARRMRKALAASLAVATALAAALILFVAVPRHASAPAWDGVKGQASSLLELSAVALSPSGTTAPIAPGGRARPGDTLVLRYRADRAGPAFLVKSGPDGQAQALGEFALSTGTHDLTDSGGVAGVSLEGEQGEVRLWLVQSPRPMTASGAVEAVRHPDPSSDVAVVGFSVRVGPGEN